MHVKPSTVPGVELIGPNSPQFGKALETLLGGTPDGVLQPALPFSVIVSNNCSRPLALLGVRFDMAGPKAKSYSVIHYADTLRYPEKANLPPGGARFVCAEPRYTDMVLRQEAGVDQRGAMNLANLRKARRIAASLDCAAFDDGQFAGPDSLGALERFQREREAEAELLHEVLAEMMKPDCPVEALLDRAIEIAAEESQDRTLLTRRALAKQFYEALAEGGIEVLSACVRSHRLKIRLWREEGLR